MKLKNKLAAVGTGLMVYGNSAMAAIPPEVTQAIEDAGTDTATIAGAVLVVMIGIAVFLWMRRAAR